MADFEYAFASAGTPTSFPIGNSGIVGIDEAGTITPKTIILAADINVLVTATKTIDEIAQAMLAWLRPRGYAPQGSGGIVASTYDGQVTPTETAVPAAD